MDLTPEIWYFEDGPPIYFYSPQQLEYIRYIQQLQEMKQQMKRRAKSSGPLDDL